MTLKSKLPPQHLEVRFKQVTRGRWLHEDHGLVGPVDLLPNGLC
jgi:hypothetical protein